MSEHSRFNNPSPVEPGGLPPLAVQILTAISRAPWASRIILGGGIALKHYADFRETCDIDAWWNGAADAGVRADLGRILADVARSHGRRLVIRRFGATDSFDFVNDQTGAKEFSFQIALRDIATVSRAPRFRSSERGLPPRLPTSLIGNISPKWLRGKPIVTFGRDITNVRLFRPFR